MVNGQAGNLSGLTKMRLVPFSFEKSSKIALRAEYVQSPVDVLCLVNEIEICIDEIALGDFVVTGKARGNVRVSTSACSGFGKSTICRRRASDIAMTRPASGTGLCIRIGPLHNERIVTVFEMSVTVHIAARKRSRRILRLWCKHAKSRIPIDRCCFVGDDVREESAHRSLRGLGRINVTGSVHRRRNVVAIGTDHTGRNCTAEKVSLVSADAGKRPGRISLKISRRRRAPRTTMTRRTVLWSSSRNVACATGNPNLSAVIPSTVTYSATCHVPTICANCLPVKIR